MSGGHYQYAEFKLEDLAEDIERGHMDGSDVAVIHDELTPTRERVAKLLRVAAKMVHAVEWADSGDTSWDEAKAEVENLFREVTP